MLYTYHLIALRDATPKTAAAFLSDLSGPVRRRAGECGGDLLGVFLPQLGFASHERAVLTRWQDEPADLLGACPWVGAISNERLHPTARPSQADRPRPGGVYVHRWFTIDPANQAEFVKLSTEAWVGFEEEFDSQVFGLFAAEPRAEDGASRRMLLMTRYAGHAVWETSRRPSAEPASRFRRRHELTALTRGCSTILAPLEPPAE